MVDRAGEQGPHAFVGRKSELATLVSALDSAQSGSGGLILLRGEAGIGKSRTAREVIAQARKAGFVVGIGHCIESDAAPAYEPWRRALHGTVAGDALAVRRTSPDAESPTGASELDVENERMELFFRVEAALRAATLDRPQLLVLEDLHWADLDSLRLLQHLVSGLDGCRWLALCTLREHESRADQEEERRSRALTAVVRASNQLPLGPLGEQEVETLVAQQCGHRPDSELVHTALRRSGGNPLFLCELIALVVASEGSVSGSALNSVGMPEVLQELMERRLERLGPDAAGLLLRGAVLGDPFEVSELATWLGHDRDSLLDSLDSAARLRLIEPVGSFADQFRFTHSLVREALLARTPRAERAERHREVAAMLEAAGNSRTEPELARLADHHRRGLSAHSAARAVACAGEAAALARRGGAPHQAVRHLMLALDSLQTADLSGDALSQRRCDLLLALGEAYSDTGERDEAQDAYLEAARIAERLASAESLALAAIGIVGRDEDPRAVGVEGRRWLEAAVRALPSEDTPLRAALLALESRLARGSGDRSRCERIGREALAIAERVGRPETWASVANALHYALASADALDERLALSQRMVEEAERGASRRTELQARQRRFTDWLYVGDTVAADDELARIEALAHGRDHPAFRWHALCLAAGCDLWRGRLESAEQRIPAAFEQGRRAGMRNAGALFAVQMFHLREVQGRLFELRPGMEQMVEANPQVRSLPLIIPLATMQEGDEVLTRIAFEPLASRDFEDVPFDTDWLAVMTTHARVAAYLRDHHRCDVLLEQLRPYAHWCIALPDGQYWEGSVSHRLALLESVLGKQDDAHRHFAAAVDCHRRAGALPALAQSLYDFGCFEAEIAGGVESARQKLTEALAVQRKIGVARFVERTEAALEALSSAAPGSVEQAPRAMQPRRLERVGAQWTLDFQGRRAAVGHRKGLSDLAVLLATPGREIHALELMVRESEATESPAPLVEGARSGSGPAALPRIDGAALAQYRERLVDLRDQREAALAQGDLATRRATDAEIEWLERELSTVFGAVTRSPSDFSQKARKAVYNRIRTAINAVEAVHPELGRHLRHSIQTGVVCVYQPETAEEWYVADATHSGGRRSI